MIIRWRSKDGNFRENFDPQAKIELLIRKIIESAPNADPSSLCLSNQPRGGATNVNSLLGRTLKDLGLSHGDLIFVTYSSAPNTDSPPTVNSDPSGHINQAIADAPVDKYWRGKDGKILRSRDPRLCTHGAKAMCEYCSSLEPFDPAYHKEHSIKHLSFHAYLRKLSPASQSHSPTSPPPLTQLSYKVKVPCPSGTHPSWPASICTACQPSAITLQPQSFRMVDHLEFASSSIIERFLAAYVKSGTQRFGWLIGHYEPYPDVPMGIKAVVEAIHEPPQEGEVDGLSLDLPWEQESRTRKLASFSNPPLDIVGQIFTDLTASQDDQTKSVYKRHPQSFYLSSLEAVWAASMQLQYPFETALASGGRFSSRFVTAVLSGTKEGGIDVAAYQVSEQACAMVEADMIEASVEPGIVRLKQEDRSAETARYMPDVFFRYRNEYGLDVQKSAKPAFPVEYLLVNVTHGFPRTPAPVFSSIAFPIENRPGLEEPSLEVLFSGLREAGLLTIQPGQQGLHIDAGGLERLALLLSDWHLVSFVWNTELLSQEDISVFMRVASSTANELPAALDKLLATDGWQNLLAIAQESSSRLPASVDNGARGLEQMDDDAVPESILAEVRMCPHCTYENFHGGSDCEVCGLPLG